jgi:Rieske Fe-S protein
MNRRTILKSLSGLLAAGCGAVVGIPGVRYLIGTVRRHGGGGEIVQRVIRLNELKVGQPFRVVVTGQRRDAWTVYARETIGRVWLVRRAPDKNSPDEGRVEAFTAVCPHLGCLVKLDDGNRFMCPCHKAAWTFDGKMVSDEALTYKNVSPRDLDSLDCRIVKDAQSGEAWVEVKYRKFELGVSQKVPRA